MFSALDNTPGWLIGLLVLLFFASVSLWFLYAARQKNEQLLNSLKYINQGIVVIDKNLTIQEWNQRYVELFDFPEGFIHSGMSLAEVVRYNAKQTITSPDDLDMQVQRRIAYYEQNLPHISSRNRASGEIIEVQANPLPDGGFVVTCSDVTDFRRAELALKEANETLEDRVMMRTKSLEHLNTELFEANKNAESVLRSKNRLLAAVSHDLMQPLNAARLFSSSLTDSATDKATQTLSKNIESSLEAAEDLIGDLLDVSRLESGKVSTDMRYLEIHNILTALAEEFKVLAKQQGIKFHYVPSSVVGYTDLKLLRRILQNLLTNAFRYCQKEGGEAHVVLGVRRVKNDLRIEVWDNGIGIPLDKQEEIFEEFTRVDPNRADQGLGLGLSIACGFARLMNHKVLVRSWPTKGTVFSVTLMRGESATIEEVIEEKPSIPSLEQMKVLCVDNEPDIIKGMETLLTGWGCDVRSALDVSGAKAQVDKDWQPKVILSDYHLNNGETGLDVLSPLLAEINGDCKGVVISADRSQEMMSIAQEHGYLWLAKPVKPLKLRALLNQTLQSQ